MSPCLHHPAARALLVAAIAALAGCKGASTPPEKTYAFRCPVQDASVTYDDGRSLTFQGATPDDPQICLARSGSGELRLAFGMVEEGGGSEGRGHRQGLREFFPARARSTASYTATVVSAGSGVQYPFETRWRTLGFDAIRVPAGRFDAVGLERVATGTGNNAGQMVTFRYWIDTASGIVVKREVEVNRGSTIQRSFQATALTVPPPPPPPGGTPPAR